MKVGIISDTHGIVRQEVMDALEGCEVILHAGDIDTAEVLAELEAIAPVHAVCGNNDWDFFGILPLRKEIELAGRKIFMTHQENYIPEDVTPYDLVIFGHSHQYEEFRDGRTLLLNPGSCGPRRFSRPVTMVVAEIDENDMVFTKIEIPTSPRSFR